MPFSYFLSVSDSFFITMALTKEQKQKKIEELQEKMKKQKSTLFITFDGLKNKEILSLRKSLRENSAELLVAKKTLTKLAFSKNNLDLKESPPEGRLGLVFNYGDSFEAMRAVHDFSSKYKKLTITGGLLDNSYINKEKAISLALLPSEEVLHTKLVLTLNAPVSNFLGVCKGNIRDLISVLSKIKS